MDDDDRKGFWEEFGNSENVRFLDASQVTLTDSEGKELLCKCGKLGTSGAIGKDVFECWCSDCSPKLDGVVVVKEMGSVTKSDNYVT